MNKGDPLQEWVDFLVKYGGHYVLVGLPSLLAIFAFRSRNRYLTKTRGKPPHHYGRTGLIYWPSQLFLFVAWCAILALSYSLGTGPYIATADGLLMSTPLVLIALVGLLLFALFCFCHFVFVCSCVVGVDVVAVVLEGLQKKEKEVSILMLRVFCNKELKSRGTFVSFHG